MSEQYWIGGFYIDLSRNQITHNNETATVAPKALSVLTYLAQHQGKVISQDELLAQVWQGTIVSPNTLQRCITQLRKALGDDGKVQVYIKTHAKKGYSLECDVHWQQDAERPPKALSSVAADNPAPAQRRAGTKGVVNRLNAAYASVAVALGLLLAVYLLFSQPTTQLRISEFRPLTATDNKEVAGIYSPDGKFIVFHRYADEFCRNSIWAKNIQTQQEFQLTANLDTNGPHSFSKDGSSLVFIQAIDCTAPLTQKTCYHLMQLDFNAALQAPQTPTLLLECNNSQIKNPKWLNNNQIALLQRSADRWQLISYSVDENSSKTLFHTHDGNIISYSYSSKDDLLAVVSVQQDDRYYLSMLQPDGKLVSHHLIDYPAQIAKFKAISPNFYPLAQQLIFSTGQQLYTLSYDGRVKAVSLPVDEAMGSPVLHKDGKRMLVIKGQYDSDIITMPLTPGQATADNDAPYQVLARSIQEESHPVIQPDSDVIAFKSSRSGQMQIWLKNADTLQQLSQFAVDTYLYEMHWAKDGQSLLVNADKELLQLGLDGSQHRYNFAHPVTMLFHWDSAAQTALALVQINGIAKFAELNLANSASRVINDAQVKWAARSRDGTVIYTDMMDRFWQFGAVEQRPIAALHNQGSDRRFVIHNHTLYGINNQFQLWRYDINTEAFEIMTQLSSKIDSVSDANESQLLMTLGVTARKEVVELILSD